MSAYLDRSNCSQNMFPIFLGQFSQCILQTLWVLQAQSLHSVSPGVNETKVPSSLLQLFLLNQGLAKKRSGNPNWGRMRFTFQFGEWDGSYPTALLETNSPTCKEVCASLNQSFFGLINLPRGHAIRQDMDFAHRTVRMSKGHLTPFSGDHFPWINWRRRC
jgi:hypothetical protein